MTECPFCRIGSKAAAAHLIFESEDVVAFPDISPSAPIHILIVPKKHIPTFTDISPEDFQIVMHMVEAAQRLITERRLQNNAYRLAFNGGRYQHVPHLHWHLVSPGR